MLAAVPDPKPRPNGPPRLTEVLFGSNHAPGSRYTQTTGGTTDIAQVGFVEDGDWSLSCNQARIGPGTIVLFPRFGDGGPPPLAGFMVCTDEPEEWEVVDDAGQPVLDNKGNVATEWFVSGRLHGWDRSLWVPGEQIQSAGWPATRSPWGTSNIRQFRNGERLTPDLVQIIVSVLPESLARLIALEHAEVTGSYPWWW